MYVVAAEIKQLQIFAIGDRWWDFSLQLIAIEIDVSQGIPFWKCLRDSSIEIIHAQMQHLKIVTELSQTFWQGAA